jgi:hypothetical protein
VRRPALAGRARAQPDAVYDCELGIVKITIACPPSRSNSQLRTVSLASLATLTAGSVRDVQKASLTRPSSDPDPTLNVVPASLKVSIGIV